MIETINGITNTFFVICLAIEFFKCFLRPKPIRRFQRVMIYVSWFIASAGIAYFMDNVFVLKIIMVCICHTLANLLLFESSSVIKRFFFSFLYVTLGIICDYLILIILESIMPQYDYYNFLESPVGMTVGTFSLLMQFLIIIVLRKIFDYSGTQIIGSKVLLQFMLTPVLSLVFITVSIIDYDAQASSRKADTTVIVALLIMLLNFSMYYILQKVIVSERDRAENILLKEQGRHYADYYQHVVEQKEGQKSRTHDYINHLKVIQDLGRKGNLKAQEKYIDEQISEVSHSQDVFETGSPIVDAVINRKYLEAKEKGISFLVEADNLTNLSISSSDLVTILSNMLDNAIEAAEQCEEKRITLKMQMSGDLLLIDSTNTMNAPTDTGSRFHTTKPDKANHGYGIGNIKRAVDNNGGQCMIESKDGLFHITIVMSNATGA